MFWELRYAASGSIWGARSITTVLLLSNITRNIWIWRGVNFFLRRKFAEKLQEEQKKKLPICWFSSCCRVQNLFIFAWEFNTRHLNIGDYLALSPSSDGRRRHLCGLSSNCSHFWRQALYPIKLTQDQQTQGVLPEVEWEADIRRRQRFRFSFSTRPNSQHSARYRSDTLEVSVLEGSDANFASLFQFR